MARNLPPHSPDLAIRRYSLFSTGALPLFGYLTNRISLGVGLEQLGTYTLPLSIMGISTILISKFSTINHVNGLYMIGL